MRGKDYPAPKTMKDCMDLMAEMAVDFGPTAQHIIEKSIDESCTPEQRKVYDESLEKVQKSVDK